MPPVQVIDHQAHWYPSSYLEQIVGAPGRPTARRGDREGEFIYIDDLGSETRIPPSFHSLEVHLADMDAHDVDVSVISPNLVGEVSRLAAADAVERLDFLHAEMARAIAAHPDRLVGLAMLPMQDPDAAIEVLDRAASDHDLAGVCILSNVAGRPIARKQLVPVYRRVQELGLPIFLHPAHTSVVDNVGYGPTIEIGLGWMFETAAAALSLIYGGILDACPDLTIVHPHLGGALPVVVDRVHECEIGVETRLDLRGYLSRNFVVDTVQKTPGAARLAVDTYGLDRLVFGTDYPWIGRAGSWEATRNALDSAEFEQVLDNRVPRLRTPAPSQEAPGYDPAPAE